ncbi:MAG TPA: GDP-mannose 4,6-dehydratase [Nitrososphaeraceae archaeon]|nr:GDP-mannose 4,6-dehydratase [Nitrososphaeraceae archaeon]
MASERVLITGITGFVAPYIAKKLVDENYQVTGLQLPRADFGKSKRLKAMGITSDIHIITGDVTDLTAILSAIQRSQPDWIFHLAAQSFVPESFRDPVRTFRVNCLGTLNILEAARLKNVNPRIIFAGSSEEYGLQFKDADHLKTMRAKYGAGIEPVPKKYPELPVDEESFFRPMSPYATSKLYGDITFRNYHNSFGLDTVVSRAFNHEGAGRGDYFVTSAIVRQLVLMHMNQLRVMKIGDVQSFRDWSHVEDIVDGYLLLARKGQAGLAYNQGSMKTYSVLSYILYTISVLGYEINKIMTLENDKIITSPLDPLELIIGSTHVESNVIDDKMFRGELQYDLTDRGLLVETNKRNFKIEFEESRFRPSDVPILLSNTNKIKELGFESKRSLHDIIQDQINYYLNSENRNESIPEFTF